MCRRLNFFEWEVEGAEKGEGGGTIAGGRHNRDGETENVFKFFIRRLGENSVFANTNR